MPNNDLELPFLHRRMFNFEQGTRFGLVVQSASVRNTTVTISGATRSGTFRIKHACVSTEIPQTERFNLPDIPIWISAIADVADIYHGEVYVQLSLSINNDIMQPLAGGYVYGFSGISWPSVITEKPIPPEWGRPETFVEPNPAAGADFTYNSPAYTVTRVQSVTFTLTTSATVANRRAILYFSGAGIGNARFFGSTDQPASTAYKYTFAPVSESSAFASDLLMTIPIPSNMLSDGELTISSDVFNLQAGDQLSAININMVQKRSTMLY